jgi:hypothetical protein
VYANGLCILYIRGIEKGRIPTPGLQFSGNLSRGVVGWNMKCNVGSFGFLSSRLSPDLLTIRSAFPRNAIASFSLSEATDHRDESFDLFRGEVFASSIYLYNAAITLKSEGLNLANVETSAKQMKIAGKVFGFSPRAKDVLRSIGGASALFPLFAQLDQPLMPTSGHPISYACDPLFLRLLIEVFFAFLRESPTNQEECAANHGFQMIGHRLANARLENITVRVLELLRRLYNEIVIPELADQLLEHIFLDFRLWVYLPIPFQLQVYTVIYDLYTAAPANRKF